MKLIQVINIAVGNVICMLIPEGDCLIYAGHEDCDLLCHYFDNTTG
jgi:hypothetical protein